MSSHRHVTKEEQDSLIDLILSEANTERGTWSLAAYNKINAEVTKYGKAEAINLIDTVTARMTDNNTSPKTRYKLAQLCSSINSQHLPQFTEAMAAHVKEIELFCQKIQNVQLGNATCRLLRSTFDEDNLKPQSASPPPTNPNYSGIKFYAPAFRVPNSSNGQTSYTPDP